MAGEGGQSQEAALGVGHAGDRRPQHLGEGEFGAMIGVQAAPQIG